LLRKRSIARMGPNRSIQLANSLAPLPNGLSRAVRLPVKNSQGEPATRQIGTEALVARLLGHKSFALGQSLSERFLRFVQPAQVELNQANGVLAGRLIGSEPLASGFGRSSFLRFAASLGASRSFRNGLQPGHQFLVIDSVAQAGEVNVSLQAFEILESGRDRL